MNHHPFPLLLKLAAAAAAGAAALLSFRRHHRLAALLSLRRSILCSLLHLPAGAGGGAAAPPAILVLGFRGHGRSAFINTACRALAGEEGPIVLRSETAPAGSPAAAELVVAAAGCGCEGEDGVGVEFIDAVALPEPAAVTAAEVEAVLDGAGGRGGGKGAAPPPECVVVVLRCSRRAGERSLAVRRLTEIAGVVRNRGLHLLVVLTHKRSLRNCKQEELKHEVCIRARTDCVYFIENYTAKCSMKCRAPTAVKNDFDTDYTALAIIRQCIEFSAQHRRQSSRKMINLATHVNDKIGEEKVDFNKS